MSRARFKSRNLPGMRRRVVAKRKGVAAKEKRRVGMHPVEPAAADDGQKKGG